jgi:predicted PurR-regulated permease PerM
MSLLLLPLVSLLSKARIPEAIGSGVSIVVLILVLAGLASLIYQPANSFLRDFPHHLRQMQERLTFLSSSLRQAGHTSEQGGGVNRRQSEFSDRGYAQESGSDPRPFQPDPHFFCEIGHRQDIL